MLEFNRFCDVVFNVWFVFIFLYKPFKFVDMWYCWGFDDGLDEGFDKEVFFVSGFVDKESLF